MLLSHYDLILKYLFKNGFLNREYFVSNKIILKEESSRHLNLKIGTNNEKFFIKYGSDEHKNKSLRNESIIYEVFKNKKLKLSKFLPHFFIYL